jgi:hypothetical protein
MIIADAEGKIIATNTMSWDGKPLDTSALIGKSVSGEEWFEKCISGGIKPGETYRKDLEEDKMVHNVTGGRGLDVNFSAPIFDKNGKPMRVWSNRISWERTIGDLMRNLETDAASDGKTISPFLIAKDGTILYYEDESKILTLNPKATMECDRNVISGLEPGSNTP